MGNQKSEAQSPGALYTVRGDNVNQVFTLRIIPMPSFGSILVEHSGFAPIEVP
jgi:hypothetical protein